MKVLIPENSFLWTPNGLAFPNNLNVGSEIFVIGSNKEIIPISIQNEIDSKKIQVTTIITNVSTLTIPQEFSLNDEGKKINIASLQLGMSINFIDNELLNLFNQYFVENIEQFSNKFFNIIRARLLGKTYIHASNNLPYLVPLDHNNEEQAREIAKNLEAELGKEAVVLKFSGNISGYGKSTDKPWKIFINEKDFVRIRKGIDIVSDKISFDIYSSGLNSFLHFHKVALDEGIPAYFNYDIRNVKLIPYVILNLQWNSKFRKLFQNACIFYKNRQLRTYDSRKFRSNNEVKIETADTNGILSEQRILDIKLHEMECFEIDIPLGSKLVIDNYLFSPVEINLEDREIIENRVNNFESIRKTVNSMSTKLYQPIAKSIKDISLFQHSHFSVVGKIITFRLQSVETKYGKKTRFDGVIEDETGEVKFSVWTSKDFFNDERNFTDKFLFIPFGITKNGIISNQFGKDIVILDETLVQIY